MNCLYCGLLCNGTMLKNSFKCSHCSAYFDYSFSNNIQTLNCVIFNSLNLQVELNYLLNKMLFVPIEFGRLNYEKSLKINNIFNDIIPSNAIEKYEQYLKCKIL